MKKRNLINLICFLLFFSDLAAKGVIPPSMVKLNDSIFIDKFEITNVDYREFLNWHIKNYGSSSIEYLSLLPDTAVWDAAHRLVYTTLYLRHPAYNNYPVVGITYEQAVKYCEWRTDRVNENFYIKKNGIKPGTDISNLKIPQKFKFRLPNRKEWEEAASFNFAKKIQNKIKSGKLQYFDVYRLAFSDENYFNKTESDITVPVNSYYPNIIGVYNIIGNVAEMIDEKGIAKGGSWIHNFDEVDVTKYFNYTKPERWLGFRCVCEVIN